MHRFLLENQISTHNIIYNFLNNLYSKADYQGNIINAFQLLASPYKPIS